MVIFRFPAKRRSRSRLTRVVRQRQRECERRALPRLTLHPDFTTVEFDEFPRDGKSEPRAFDLLGRGTNLPELLEHRRLVLWRDAHSGVRH